MRNQVALGIDISERQISIAKLMRVKDGVKVLKAASAPVPDGAIKDGYIEEPEILAKAIKELKSHCRILSKRAAVSLSTGSTIVHILEAPKGAPSNVSQFVRKELKSYIALSGREISDDFCGINSGQGMASRLLAVAVDSNELSVLSRTCTRAGLDLEAIEPSIIGYIRALFAERIEGKFDSDVLIAVLHGGVLTLCVFRKQTLDFIKVEDINGENTEPGDLCRWLAGRINEVVQYYDIEVADGSGKWEVTIVADDVELPDDAAASLRDNIAGAGVEVRTGDNACQDTLIDQSGCKGQPSALAMGLAMGLLGVRQNGLKINLVPPESAEVKATKKQVILTAIVIAVVLPLLMIAAGMGLNRLADKTKAGISDKKQAELSGESYTAFRELVSLGKQIDLLSKRPDEISEILDSRPVLDWAKILNDIKNKTPKKVRITELYSTGDTGIVLEGLALTYGSVRKFEETLNELEYVNLASLVEASREDNADAVVTYKINCSLDNKKIEI
jgi:Tfp pilus assembly protein PilN